MDEASEKSWANLIMSYGPLKVSSSKGGHLIKAGNGRIITYPETRALLKDVMICGSSVQFKLGHKRKTLIVVDGWE